MAANPNEMPEHPNDSHQNDSSSPDSAPPPNFSTISPSYQDRSEEEDAAPQIDASTKDSWSDTSWSGIPVQPNQAIASTDQEQSSQNQLPNNSVHSEESSEILRGRADSLLDEMMLGAIDVSAGGPQPNGAYEPNPAESQPEYIQPRYDQPRYEQRDSAPPQSGGPQPTRHEYSADGYSTDYAADLGGPATQSPNSYQNPRADSQQPPVNPAYPTQTDAQQPYPTVSREMSNQAQANQANLIANPNSIDRQQLYGNTPSPQQPATQYSAASEGALYPPSSLSSQQVNPNPQLRQPPVDHESSYGASGYTADPAQPHPDQPYVDPQTYNQAADLRPPAVSGPNSYPVQKPPPASYAAPNHQPYGNEVVGRGSFSGSSNDPATSGISYFEKQRLSYAERYAFEREQERKQWSIATGKSNDYLSSVPRYPRETRDELGRETQNPYNPASTPPLGQNVGQYSARPAGQYAQPQQYGQPPSQQQTDGYPPTQYPSGQYPPAPNPATYQSSQHGYPQQPSQGQHNSGQQQYNQQGYDQHQHDQQQYNQPRYDQQYTQPQYAQPQYNQGQYAQPRPPSYQGHIPELGPVIPGQQRTSPFADPMSVGSQSRQMDLLPRETKMSVQALQEEMLALHSKIDTALPIGHDTADRARHLLDKGRSILEQDPYRSAEVSYYVQQVKAILQRAGQRTQWSNTYRARLLYYLIGWFFLSLIALASCMIYSDQLRTFFTRSAADPNSTILGQHAIPFLATVAAGTLGSAISALFNMWRYSQRDYGFFDRKYGLLGIVLPVISLFFGMVVYLIFGFIAELFNIQPSSNLLISVVPAVIAFAFGTMQEKIYGTSD